MFASVIHITRKLTLYLYLFLGTILYVPLNPLNRAVHQIEKISQRFLILETLFCALFGKIK